MFDNSSRSLARSTFGLARHSLLSCDSIIVSQPQEVRKQLQTLLGKNGLWMELNAVSWLIAVYESHNLDLLGTSCYR